MNEIFKDKIDKYSNDFIVILKHFNTYQSFKTNKNVQTMQVKLIETPVEETISAVLFNNKFATFQHYLALT